MTNLNNNENPFEYSNTPMQIDNEDNINISKTGSTLSNINNHLVNPLTQINQTSNEKLSYNYSNNFGIQNNDNNSAQIAAPNLYLNHNYSINANFHEEKTFESNADLNNSHRIPSFIKQKNIICKLLGLNPLLQSKLSSKVGSEVKKVALINSEWWNKYKRIINLNDSEILNNFNFNDISPQSNDNDYLNSTSDIPLQDATMIDSEQIKDSDAAMNDKMDVEIDASNLLPIDNYKLIEKSKKGYSMNEPQIPENLFENIHYNYISIEAFEMLLQWFGGGPKIYRPLVKINSDIDYLKFNKSKEYVVNINPIIAQLAIHDPNKKEHNFINVEIYKGWNMKQLRKFFIKYLKNNNPQLYSKVSNFKYWRVWDAYCSSPNRLRGDEMYVKDILEEMKNNFEIKDVSLEENEDTRYIQFLFEYRTEFGKYSIYESPLSKNTEIARTIPSLDSYNSKQLNKFGMKRNEGNNVKTIKGVSGLENLGNTCFMNSALQCLTKTPQIKDYFINQEYEKEINYENPLGMKGEIANAFADIMKLVWSGDHSKISPKAFKDTISKRAPQFIGYHQHDSCELIQYLIDGIHEDLNRIENKPITLAVEGENMSDKEKSQYAWNVHKLRNDSIIVDKFTGQLKSVLVCPICKNVSTTFDPFLYLPLPLPSPERMIELYIVTKNITQPWKKVYFPVKNSQQVSYLREKISSTYNLDPKNIIFADVLRKIYEYYPNNKRISEIKETDKTYIYEIDGITDISYHNEDYDRNFQWIEIDVEINNMMKENYSIGSLYNHSKNLFGFPILAPFKNDFTSSKEIYQFILSQAMRLLSPSDLENSNLDLNNMEKLFYHYDNPTPLLTISHRNEKIPYNDKPLKLDKFYKFEMKATFDGEVININGKSLSRHFSEFNLSQDNLFESDPNPKNTKDSSITLQSCIELFQTPEQLGENDMWRCKICKDFVQANKTIQIWKLPEVLIIQLKRFQFHDRFGGKVNTFVNYPIDNLDLSKFIPPNEKNKEYELFAVSNHIGGLGGGHYVAHAKVDNQWYKFNDNFVSKVDSSQICTSDAYILFYTSKNQTQAQAGVRKNGKELAKEWGLEKFTES